MSVLVGTVIWCPSGQDGRATIIKNHLFSLVLAQAYASSKNIDTRVVVVDNDTEDTSVVDLYKSFAELYNWEIKLYKPQIGWGRGRNSLMQSFSESKYTRLVMMDCDMVYLDKTWIEKVEILDKTDPDLHAYMIRPDKYQIHERGKLPSGTEIDIYEEGLGTSNVIDRKALEVVGGYDVKTFPQPWGFLDPEIFRRFKYSGLLDYCDKKYVDPIRVEAMPDNNDTYNKLMDPFKQKWIAEYNVAFVKREWEIRQGKNIWLPFSEE